LHHRTKFRKDRSNRCGDNAIFVIFKMAAAAILDFQKFEILTSCQISSKSVKRLQRYGDLTFFKMAAVRHLGFVGHYDYSVVSIVVQNLVDIDEVVSIV